MDERLLEVGGDVKKWKCLENLQRRFLDLKEGARVEGAFSGPNGVTYAKPLINEPRLNYSFALAEMES